MLVEGGVQRSGGRVRVTVQLVDGSTAVHLWAEHYDRELSATNALEVQSEVAAAVSDALKNVLTSSHVDRRVVVSTTAPTSRFSEGRVGEVCGFHDHNKKLAGGAAVAEAHSPHCAA